MAKFFGRMWDRAQGKLDVLRICDKVFEELVNADDKVFEELVNADKNTKLLDINSLHIATLMVYNLINKQLIGPHKDPPCMNDIAEIMERYRAKKREGITQQEFQGMIMEWVRKDLRIVLVNKAAIAILAAPLLAVTAKNAARQVPRMRDAVEKVPTPLLFTIFSAGLMLL